MSVLIGYVNAAVLGVLCVVSVGVARRRRTAYLVPLLLLGVLALHPAWTVSASQGDCGDLKRLTSWLGSGGAVLAVVCQRYFAPPDPA